MVNNWTPELVEVVTKRWLAGESATHIAKALGLTRGAVIGKVHRLGIERQRDEVSVASRRVSLLKLSFDDK